MARRRTRKKATRRNKSRKRSLAAKKGWRRRRARKASTRRNPRRKRRTTRRRKTTSRRRRTRRNPRKRRRRKTTSRRRRTRRNPRRRRRTTRRRSYRRNPVAALTATAKEALNMKTWVDAAYIAGGMVTAVVGEQIVVQKFGKTSEIARFAGAVGGSAIGGGVVALISKSKARGIQVLVGGLAYSIIKLAYNRFIAGNATVAKYTGLAMPAVGDFLTMPALPQGQVGDYVTMPPKQQLGQFGYETRKPAFQPQSMAGTEQEIDW